MIAHLHGELARIEADYIVIDVHGIGYKVHPPLAVIAQMPHVGDEVKLLISTIVREDSLTLYGFSDESQQSMFELLLTVSGVGPKVGLNILSVLSVEEIVNAISTESFRELNRVPGVGTKTAQRIVLELKEKIATLVWTQAARRNISAEQRNLEDAVDGLLALGYPRNDARSAVEEAMRSATDKSDAPSLLRHALKILAGN